MSKKMNLGIATVCMAILCNLNWALAAEDMVATLLVPNTVPQGEPLPITVQVKNVSQEYRIILIPVIRRFGPDTVLFSVKAPDDVKKQPVQRPDIYVGGLKNMTPSTLPITRLAPGATAVYSFSLAYDFPDAKRRKRLFDTPGRYVVQAKVFELVGDPGEVKEVPYDAQRRAVESESVDVEILHPKSQRAKDALQAMKSLPDEYLIYDPFVFRSDCHAESAKQLKEYFGHYADTEIGQRAAFPLGIAVAEGVVSDDSGVIRKTIESLSQSKQAQLRSTAATVLEKMIKRKQ
jgi:hypothetical protein